VESAVSAKIFIDEAPGETRVAVAVDGRPERLFIEREGEADRPRLGDVFTGRVEAAAPGFRGHFVELGMGPAGLLPAAAGGKPAQGALVEVEIASEARADKGPVVKRLGEGRGNVGRISAGASIEARLQAAYPDAVVVYDGAARDACDVAEEIALLEAHPLAGGLDLSVERTRGLIAVDVDFSRAEAGARAVFEANRRALKEAARLLRLKGLGGLVVIDLIGKASDHAALLAAAREAFAPDQPGVTIAGISKLGVLELALPWRQTPVVERLLDPYGDPTPRTVAQRLARTLAAEGRADPGARLVARCAPEVAAELAPLIAEMGPRYAVAAEVGRGRLDADIRAA